MERTLFTEQMKRLAEVYGERAYPKERMTILWNCFRDVTDTVFTDSVTELIGSCRSMPLMKEFEAAVEVARTREKESHYQRGKASIFDAMEDAAEKTPNKDLAKVCCDLVRWKMDSRPAEDEWQETLKILDKLVRKPTGPFCRSCDGGIVFHAVTKMGCDYSIAYRCHCSLGQSQAYLQNAPRRDVEREYLKG